MKEYVGGQAVIEGVMMRSSSHVATAVRKPDGKIVIKKQEFESITKKNKLLSLPVIRGIIFLFEMMIFGVKTLMWSAEQQENNKKQKLSTSELFWTLFISFTITILLFIVLPFYLTKFFIKNPTVGFHLLDGLFRLSVFLGYIIILGFSKDVCRIFQYHGAEHKTVNCYESKLSLTIKNVKKFPTAHPRCGTSLIVVVIALSIVIFALIKTPIWYVNLAQRIIFIPLIAGLGYEIAKFLALRYDKKFWFWLTKPGMWTQSLTTKEPDEKQIEVAIKALKNVI